MSRDILEQLTKYLIIENSEDEMSATLKRVSTNELITFDVAMLTAFLAKSDITTGIDETILSEIVNHQHQNNLGEYIVARGIAPIKGADGEVVYVYLEDKSEPKGPKILEDGSVDFYNIKPLDNVKKGQIVARLNPPTHGIPGMSVKGVEIPGANGKEARFKVGKNVVLSPDQKALYSVIDGMVVFTGGEKLNVFPIYEVNGDVDFHIGNIDFVGTVIVRGNVLTGFKIKASGNIRVLGNVEGADLVAGGWVEVNSGITGNHKGSIYAGTYVKTSYINNANVVAAEDVFVSQSIMNSVVKAGKSVICKGSKGLIVGGETQAREKVVAQHIGNTVSMPTTLEIGVAPELREELAKLRDRIKEITDSKDKIDKALLILEPLAKAGQLSPEKNEMRIKLISSLKQLEDEMLKIKERVNELEIVLNDTGKARIDVSGTIYPGVKIRIGKYMRHINDAMSLASFRLEDGEIKAVPL